MTYAIIFLSLVESMSFVLLFLPFGVLAAVQTVRSVKSPGQPNFHTPIVSLKSWHVVAFILVIWSLAVIVARSAVADWIWGQAVFFVITELSFWSVFAPLVFGLLYVGRLKRSGVPNAGLMGLGVCLIPATVFVLTPTNPANDAGVPTAIGAVGIIAYGAALLAPRGRFKTATFALACFALILSLSGWVGPANSMWLFFSIAAGYSAYRIEWKTDAHASKTDVHKTRDEPKSSTSLAPSIAFGRYALSTRLLGFIIVNEVFALILWLVVHSGIAFDKPLHAVHMALVALAIAVFGSMTTALTSRALAARGSLVDDAASSFVVLLVVASVLHLAAAPPVESFVLDDSSQAKFWKPVLGLFAILGASVTVLSTFTGKARQLCPFMLGIILPAVFLLPSDSFFTFLREDSPIVWSQRLVEAGITATMLGLMWYVFGPGRRRESEQSDEVRDRTHDGGPGVIPA